MSRPLALRIKAEAMRLGFIACGIAPASPMPEAQRQFEERIERGFLDGLPWMNSSRAERATNPDMLLDGIRSIISVAAPCERPGPPKQQNGELRGKVARYAWGRDYHRALDKSLRELCLFIEADSPGARSRILVDYGPLMERAYAARSGVGWFGKSTSLLLPGAGSWVLLAEVLTTVALDPDVPIRKSCGACQRCVDACPTGALVDGYLLDNKRCISFQTIENRGPIPRELRPLIGDWLFGCDICQEVCPVGRSAQIPPMPSLAAMDKEDAAPALLPLLKLTEDDFRRRFAGRAVMRAKRDGLIRNACVVLGNLGDRRAVPALIGAMGDGSALVRGHAAWALGRLGGDEARECLASARRVESDAWVADEIELAIGEVGD